MRRTDPKFVLFSHFGPSPDGAEDLVRYRTIVEKWRDVALAAARERPDVDFITERLRSFDATETAASDTRDRESIISSYDVTARGFLRYFQTHDLLGRDPA